MSLLCFDFSSHCPYQNGLFYQHDKIVGREREIEALENCYASDRSEFVAVYGRRRVGKTFLVKTLFKNRLDFNTTGILGGNNETQLNAWNYKFSSGEYQIDKKTSELLRNKRTVFTNATKSRKAAITTMITTFGLKKNIYSAEIVSEVVLNDLFEAKP